MDFKRLIGRPPKFETPEQMQEAITEYFKSLMDDGAKLWLRPPTMAGLGLALGLSRQGLLNYGNENKKDKGFVDTVTHARRIVESFNEEMLHTGKNPSGTMFNMINNFGYKQKYETKNEHTGSLSLADAINLGTKQAGIKDEN